MYIEFVHLFNSTSCRENCLSLGAVFALWHAFPVHFRRFVLFGYNG